MSSRFSLTFLAENRWKSSSWRACQTGFDRSTSRADEESAPWRSRWIGTELRRVHGFLSRRIGSGVRGPDDGLDRIGPDDEADALAAPRGRWRIPHAEDDLLVSVVVEPPTTEARGRHEMRVSLPIGGPVSGHGAGLPAAGLTLKPRAVGGRDNSLSWRRAGDSDCGNRGGGDTRGRRPAPDRTSVAARPQPGPLAGAV
jgi:hypothetical protein